MKSSVPPRRAAVNRKPLLVVDGLRKLLRRVVASSNCLLCAGLAAPDELICGGCQDDLPWNDPACLQCAQALATPPSRICADCISHAPPFERAIAAFRYRGEVARAVQSLKYNASFLSANWLGMSMANNIRSRIQSREEALPDVLIAVPLHRTRLRERGFNQAQELARVVARSLPLRLETDWAQRIRSTADQIGLDAVQRRRNVKEAFVIDARVAGLKIALLDDVMTTGSTLSELARTCRKAGAASVVVWTAARA